MARNAVRATRRGIGVHLKKFHAPVAAELSRANRACEILTDEITLRVEVDHFQK